jgi:hypothetical protein
MVNSRGYFGVISESIKSEKLVILLPIAFVNFFAVGFVLHGVVYAFKALDFSQVAISVTLSMLIFFGEMVSLLIPTKVLVDRKIAADLKNDREIIRLSFDEQDREIFKRLKTVSNSLTLIVTGIVNYLLIAMFLFLWLSNGKKPLDVYFIVNSLAPMYIFFIALNFIALAYDLLKGKNK